MKSPRARPWLLGMTALLLFFTYLIFWVQPHRKWARRSPPSVSAMIRALQRKDSGSNEFEVALWDHLPISVQRSCLSLRPRLARETRADACGRLGSLGAQAAEAVPCLSKALDDPDIVVRSSAILAIKAIGPSAKAAKGRLLATLVDLVQRGPTNQFFMMELDLVPRP